MSIYATISSTISKTISGTIGFGQQSFVQRFGAGLSAAYFLADLGSKRGTVDGVLNPVVRVRRTNGDLSAFTAANVASGAMLTYVGTGGSDNGQTAKLYDGSGNARDQLQNTVADMPLSVSGGALVAVNSSPALRFNGTSSFLVGDSTDALITDASQPFSMFVVTKMNDLTGVQRILSTAASASQNFKGVSVYTNGSAIAVDIINSHPTQSIIARGGNIGSNQALLSVIYDGSKSVSGVSLWLNGSAVSLNIVTSDTLTVNDISSQFLGIGASDVNGGGDLFAHMDFQFAAVYATANKSADRPAIEASLAKEYNITLA